MDYYVEPGTAYPTIASVLTDPGFTGSATVCVLPTSTGTSVLCPGGHYQETVYISGGDSLQIYAYTPVCWEGTSPSDPAITFDGAGSSSITDFAGINCRSGTAPGTPALDIIDTDFSIQGMTWAMSGSSYTSSVVCAYTGSPALRVDEGAIVTSNEMHYTESNIGVLVRGGTSVGTGGALYSTNYVVEHNHAAFLAEDYSSIDVEKAFVYDNYAIGFAGDHAVVVFTDTRFTDNSIPSCGSTFVPYHPSWWPSSNTAAGFSFEDDAYGEFINDRWVGNCTHMEAQTGLVRTLGDQADLYIQNNTMDRNEAWVAVQHGGRDLTILDSIFSDYDNDYGLAATGFLDSAIQCGGTGTKTVDAINLYNFDYDWAPGYPCSCLRLNAGKSWYDEFKGYSPDGSIYLERYYHLKHDPIRSALVDYSPRTASSVFPSGGYGTAPYDPWKPSKWMDDTGDLDLGFHWWALPWP